MSLPNFVEAFTAEQLAHLTELATTFALSHSLAYLPIDPPSTPLSAIHAPLSLIPAPFPRHLFQKALRIQKLYNLLYGRIASDDIFLDEFLGENGVGSVDDFTNEQWKGWKEAKKDGANSPQLGLFRSDYLLHSPNGTSDLSQLQLKQVEFNTISSSFGPLAVQTASLHRYLQRTTRYFGVHPFLEHGEIPPNRATQGLVEGLATAHEVLGDAHACILFVVQERERNVFDQRLLEYELAEVHSIRVIRKTMTQLLTSASLDPETKDLFVQDTLSNESHKISVVYFRATYTPADFPTTSHWTMRTLIEKSRAIKCPSLALQLAGGKRVQEILTRPGVLERFLPEVNHDDLKDIRESWVGMWALDSEISDGRNGVDEARERHLSLVVKPQREGGGNNIYRESIPPFLDRLNHHDRKAWIAMEMIETPDVEGLMVRAGTGQVTQGPIISELGVFGWALFGGSMSDKEFKQGEDTGWLVRTKGKESNEGGVAVGFSVLDSIVLVN